MTWIYWRYSDKTFLTLSPAEKPVSLSLSVSSCASSSSERSTSGKCMCRKCTLPQLCSTCFPFSLVSWLAPFEDARASAAEVFSSLDPSTAAPLSSQDDPLPAKKKEKLSGVNPPSYFGLVRENCGTECGTPVSDCKQASFSVGGEGEVGSSHTFFARSIFLDLLQRHSMVDLHVAMVNFHGLFKIVE